MSINMLSFHAEKMRKRKGKERNVRKNKAQPKLPTKRITYLDDTETENNADHDKQQSIYNHPQYHQLLMSVLLRTNKRACDVDCKENDVYCRK